ncbi:hypothetical protein J6590_048964 [Homalodisca vitripennis]|nr:hypothetical protein J6590_048964 [Homalodisca vitripennis]
MASRQSRPAGDISCYLLGTVLGGHGSCPQVRCNFAGEARGELIRVGGGCVRRYNPGQLSPQLAVIGGTKTAAGGAARLGGAVSGAERGAGPPRRRDVRGRPGGDHLCRRPNGFSAGQ